MSAGARACDDPHHCITCGDDGVPMRVLELDEARALALCADEAGTRRSVETTLVGALAVGETVLVHADVALTRMDLPA